MKDMSDNDLKMIRRALMLMQYNNDGEWDQRAALILRIEDELKSRAKK